MFIHCRNETPSPLAIETTGAITATNAMTAAETDSTLPAAPIIDLPVPSADAVPTITTVPSAASHVVTDTEPVVDITPRYCLP